MGPQDGDDSKRELVRTGQASGDSVSRLHGDQHHPSQVVARIVDVIPREFVVSDQAYTEKMGGVHTDPPLMHGLSKEVPWRAVWRGAALALDLLLIFNWEEPAGWSLRG